MVMRWAGLGALNALLAVAAGAFGAHALRERLDPHLLEVFETGVRYHLIHALGLFAVAFVASQQKPTRFAGIAMLVGIVLFSGSLYALALSGVRLLGIITPFGGVAFLLAWGSLAWTCLTDSRNSGAPPA